MMRRLDAALPEPARRVLFLLVLLLATLLSYRKRTVSEARARRYVARELHLGASFDEVLAFLKRHH